MIAIVQFGLKYDGPLLKTIYLRSQRMNRFFIILDLELKLNRHQWWWKFEEQKQTYIFDTQWQ